MRISDWSSDVCSSDLLAVGLAHAVEAVVEGVGEEAPGSGQREARVRTAVRLEQDRRPRRRQGQRVGGRDPRDDGDGNGELKMELSAYGGDEQYRHEELGG